ncbi:MAG: sigma-54-dependent Fis family transcriptional regulator [Planctomycetes bacterium]|nr:sigma-54-dependent Fis family transcriptional regulator [Planctomycetota bacterium]
MTAHILIVDDHAAARESMSDILRHAGYRTTACSGAAEGLRHIEHGHADLVVTDLQMPGMDGLDFLKTLQTRRIDAPVVMVTAHASVESAVAAMRYGAFDYIEKPFDAERLERLVARALRDGAAVQQRVHPGGVDDSQAELVGSSRAMRTLRHRISQVAPTPETVLVTGESGTGKELVARRVHLESRRAEQSLVSLNCPALSPQLMESELFGHERGAFTGADSARVGRFELADGGTLFLDEITEIQIGLQAKLLRVLQERMFERVGSSASRRVDVRVLATTNRDLRTEVAGGRFREDLYYRLNVLPIAVPPLRERRDDIPELVNHFRQRVARRLDQEPVRFSPGAERLLTRYGWPGNVRELENIVTRVSVLHHGEQVAEDALEPWLMEGGSRGSTTCDTGDRPEFHVGTSLQEMERRLIESTLEHYDGHRVKAAQALGIGVRTLSNKLRGYGYAPRARHFARTG